MYKVCTCVCVYEFPLAFVVASIQILFFAFYPYEGDFLPKYDT